MAGLYQAHKDFAKAEPLFRNAVAIRKEALGEKDAAFIKARDEAEKFYDEWLDGFSDKTLDDTDAVNEFETILEKKLAFDRKSFGEWHEHVAQTLMRLAMLHEGRQDFAAAVKDHQERLAVAIKHFGSNHPQVADARAAVAHLQRLAGLTADQRGQWQEAERLEALGEYRKKEGNVPDAIKSTEQSLNIRKRLVGENDLSCVECLDQLASLHVALGEPQAGDNGPRTNARDPQTVGRREPPGLRGRSGGDRAAARGIGRRRSRPHRP